MRRRLNAPPIAVVLILSAVLLAATPAPPVPPVARKIPKVTQIHGNTLVDDYFWLREKENPEVLAYLRAEAAYADAAMASTKPLQETLYREMVGRIREDDTDVPYREGKYFYYTRTEEGKQYPLYCRKKGSVKGREEVMLDLNALAAGLPYFDVDAVEVSPDGRLLAFTTDTTGFRQFVLNVKDLRTGKVAQNIAQRVTSVVWANYNRTLFYVQEDEVTKRSWRCYRVRLGGAKQDLLYEEPDALYSLWLERPLDGSHIQLNIASKDTTEVRLLPADHPEGAFRTLLPRRDGREYFVTSANGLFYIRTNDHGVNFRLVTAPVATPGPEHWTEVIPHRPEVMLEAMYCFKDFFVVEERKDGVPSLRVFPKKGAPRTIDFPEPSFILSPENNHEFESRAFRFSYESLVTPHSLYDFDVRTGKRTLLKREEVLGGYDPKQYVAERLWAPAPDGVKVPISIVYKREPAPAGPRPMVLQGYGSYGIPEEPYFSSSRLSLIDRGFVYGLAHVRGGGDLGKAWHDQGKMMAKRNTFTDFIACAEYLVREGITAPDRLVITGGSAGGLLMGAVVNLRPDLFKAVVAQVPFVDVINTMLDDSLPLTVEEYLEWGNPHEPAAYAYMKGYSPYDNLEAKAYPAMLVESSLNDSQVMYWEPAKYVAKLRALKTDANPLLFKIRLDPGGHGGASGRYDQLKDKAFDYAFILTQAGTP